MADNEFYPIFLNVKNLPCLVVGGGVVAERKIETLLGLCATITVVSPAVTDTIKEWANSGKITYINSLYESKHIDNMWMVIGATNDHAANEKIFQDSEKAHIISNIVDQPHICRFIVPAVIQQEGLSIAISTGGAAPSLSGMMRRELENDFVPKYLPAVEASRVVRSKVKNLPDDAKRAFWEMVRTSIEQWHNEKKNKEEIIEQMEEWVTSTSSVTEDKSR